MPAARKSCLGARSAALLLLAVAVTGVAAADTAGNAWASDSSAAILSTTPSDVGVMAELLISSDVGVLALPEMALGPGTIVVERQVVNNHGTWGGVFVHEAGKWKHIGFSLERRPSVGKGPIPEGAYQYRQWMSQKLGKTERFYNVPGFTNILIHVGNTEKETQGCILVGKGVDSMTNPTRLRSSRVLVNWLYDNKKAGTAHVYYRRQATATDFATDTGGSATDTSDMVAGIFRCGTNGVEYVYNLRALGPSTFDLDVVTADNREGFSLHARPQDKTIYSTLHSWTTAAGGDKEDYYEAASGDTVAILSSPPNSSSWEALDVKLTLNMKQATPVEEVGMLQLMRDDFGSCFVDLVKADDCSMTTLGDVSDPCTLLQLMGMHFDNVRSADSAEVATEGDDSGLNDACVAKDYGWTVLAGCNKRVHKKCSNNCYGRCGPGCTTWKKVCGDGKCHGGCYAHDWWCSCCKWYHPEPCTIGCYHPGAIATIFAAGGGCSCGDC